MRLVVIGDSTGRITAGLRKLEKMKVTIGVHGDTGTYGTGGESVAEVAATQEFGSGNIPERSFLRAGIDQSYQTIGPDLIEQIQGMIANTGPTPTSIAKRGGVLILGAVRQVIADRIAPELAESTKQKRDEKGGNSVGVASNVGAYTPLVDTGQLWQSLTFKVEG